MTSNEQDWADISDDEEEAAPTVKVDSLDLKSLSLTDKDASAGDNMTSTQQISTEGRSLADRISDDVKPEKPEEKGKETIAAQDEDKSETKEKETNLVENKYEVAVKLQDLQADPNSPLYSVKSFEELGL